MPKEYRKLAKALRKQGWTSTVKGHIKFRSPCGKHMVVLGSSPMSKELEVTRAKGRLRKMGVTL